MLAENRDLIQLTRPQTRFNRCGYVLQDVLTPAGLDLAKLFVGSEGTLGLITEATVRTVRVRVRLRRPRVPHLGHGDFLGAQRTGITIDVGASVPMLVSLVMRCRDQSHSPGHGPYHARAKRLIAVR